MYDIRKGSVSKLFYYSQRKIGSIFSYQTTLNHRWLVIVFSKPCITDRNIMGVEAANCLPIQCFFSDEELKLQTKRKITVKVIDRHSRNKVVFQHEDFSANFYEYVAISQDGKHLAMVTEQKKLCLVSLGSKGKSVICKFVTPHGMGINRVYYVLRGEKPRVIGCYFARDDSGVQFFIGICEIEINQGGDVTAYKVTPLCQYGKDAVLFATPRPVAVSSDEKSLAIWYSDCIVIHNLD